MRAQAASLSSAHAHVQRARVPVRECPYPEPGHFSTSGHGLCLKNIENIFQTYWHSGYIVMTNTVSGLHNS